MLASTGTLDGRVNWRYSSSVVSASAKIMSGAGFDVALRALDRGVWPFDRVRVGARHDHERIVGAAVDGGLDAIDHLVGADQRLAGTMTAALGLHLVLEVQAGGAGADQLARRARDVESGAPAGVGVERGAGVRARL